MSGGLKTAPKRKSWKKRILVGGAFILMIALGFVIMLPTLAGTGVGVSLVNSFLASDSGRSIEVESLSLRWSGAQRIRGVTITDDANEIASLAELEVTGSLISWIRGSRDFGETKLAGTVTVYRQEEPAEVLWPDGLAADLRLAGLNVVVVNPDGSRTTIQNMQGSADVGAAQPITMDVTGEVKTDAGGGSFAVKGNSTGLIHSNGQLDPMRATYDLTLSLEDVPGSFVDTLANANGRVLAALGDSTAATAMIKGNSDKGDLELSLTADQASFKAVVTIADGVLSTTSPATFSVDMSQDDLASWLGEARLAGLVLESSTVLNGAVTARIPIPKPERAWNLMGASIDTTLQLDAARVTTGIEDLGPISIKSFSLAARSADITDTVTVIGDLKAVADATGQPLNLDGNIEISDAIKPTGATSFETLALSGTVNADAMPTPLVDIMADLDGWGVDLLGPELTKIAISASPDASSEGMTRIGLDVQTPVAMINGAVTLEEGKIQLAEGSTGSARLTLGVAAARRINALTGPTVTMEPRGTIAVSVDALSINLNHADGAAASLATNGTASVVGAGIRVTPTDKAPASLDVSNFDLTFNTSSLADSITLTSQGSVRTDVSTDAVGVRADTVVRRPLDGASRRRYDEVFVEANSVPTAFVQRWVDAAQWPTINNAIGSTVTLQAAGSLSSSSRNMQVSARSSLTDVTMVWQGLPDGRVELSGRGKQNISPTLVESLRPGVGEPRLRQPVDLEFTMTPSMVSPPLAGGSTTWKDALFDAGFNVAFKTGGNIVAEQVPGTAQPITVSGLAGDVKWAGRPSGKAMNVTGLASVAEVGQGVPAVERGEFAIALWPDTSKFQVDKLILSGVRADQVERLAGLSPSTLTAWLGLQGTVALQTLETDQTVRLALDFEDLKVDLAGYLRGDVVELARVSSASVNVDQAFFDSILNKPSKKPDAKPRPRLSVASSVPVTAELRRLVLPTALLRGGEAPGALVEIDASIRVTEPLRIQLAGAPLTRFSDLRLDISGTNLAEGLTIAIDGLSKVAERTASGEIDLTGTIRGQTTSADALVMSLEGSVSELSVRLVDSYVGGRGALLASMGPTMRADMNIIDYGTERGKLTLNMVSDSATLSVEGADLTKDAFIATAPINAKVDVRPEFSSRLLNEVNPMFYDAQKKSGPVMVAIKALSYPLDGDLTKLNADFVLDLGQVDVPKSGILGELLGTMKPSTPAMTETKIPPVQVVIENGILKYDKLVLQSPEFNIKTYGQVNLARRTLDLKADVPLLGWKHLFPPLGDDVDSGIKFYMLINGTIDDPKVKPDPNGVKRVLEEGVLSLPEQIIKRGIGDLLNPGRNKGGGGGGG